jgi:hypothetical protein
MVTYLQRIESLYLLHDGQRYDVWLIFKLRCQLVNDGDIAELLVVMSGLVLWLNSSALVGQKVAVIQAATLVSFRIEGSRSTHARENCFNSRALDCFSSRGFAANG